MQWREEGGREGGRENANVCSGEREKASQCVICCTRYTVRSANVMYKKEPSVLFTACCNPLMIEGYSGQGVEYWPTDDHLLKVITYF